MCEPIDPRSVSEGCAIDPPDLKASVTPKKKKDLPGPGDAKPLKDHHLPVDILLLTAKDCEFLSCLAFLDDGFFNVHDDRLGFLFLGEMGKNEKLKIAVIQCSAGAGGPDGAIIVTTEAVKILRPKAVFCVGFCGSLNREKVKLGDVVLSERLRTYAWIKRTASGIQDRNVSVQLHTRLAKLIKSVDYGWKAPLTEPGKLKVEVHKNGVFLSGPEVVDEKERREGLIDRFRDAIAIEMEGEGVYAAAHNLNVEWIVIKGVSDYADGKKSATDSWRPFASTIAASLTAHILSNPVVFKDWPHYECASAKQTAKQDKGKYFDMPPKKPAFDLKTSVKTPSGYALQISLKVMDKLSTVGAMLGGMACGAAAVVGSVTYLILNNPGLVKAAVKAALAAEDVQVESVGPGSILVEVLCTSKESFLLFMHAFETNKIRQRLEEEFQNKLNFKGELEVKITNEQEVYEDLDHLRRLEKKHAVEEVEGHMSVKTEVDLSGIPITEMCELTDPMSVSEGCAVDPPEASVTPPEKKDLPGLGDAKPLEDVHLPVDILLLTAKDCEFLSCLAFLDDGFFNVHHDRLGFLFLGKMGKNETKLKIAVIQCSAGADGPDGAIIVVTEAVKILRPKAVFCVGFCGSLNRKKVKLGDVVLSARLKTYAWIDRTASGIQERNINVPLNIRLEKLIQSADYGWEAPLTEPGKLKVEVHKDGVFLSGPGVVDAKGRREGLIHLFRDAIAIEMEGEGVYAAAHTMNVEWIVIKGVSDYADGKMSATDSWRPFASTMAASLTAHILSNPVVFKDWPHYECAKPTTKKRELEVAPIPKREQRQSSSSSTGDSMEIVKAEPIATKKRKLEGKGLTVKPGCPSMDDLRLLTKELADGWKDLASCLKFGKAEITAFHRQNENLADKAKEMLLKWKARNGNQATYQVLYDALCNEVVQNRLLAEKFCCS